MTNHLVPIYVCVYPIYLHCQLYFVPVCSHGVRHMVRENIQDSGIVFGEAGFPSTKQQHGDYHYGSYRNSARQKTQGAKGRHNHWVRSVEISSDNNSKRNLMKLMNWKIGHCVVMLSSRVSWRTKGRRNTKSKPSDYLTTLSCVHQRKCCSATSTVGFQFSRSCLFSPNIQPSVDGANIIYLPPSVLHNSL